MGEPQLSLRRLEVFCLVVELGGVTRAAEQLMVAQPAISAQMKALEEWFGAPLFRRNAGRLQTTEAGANAYRWAKETLARAISVRRFTQELALGGAGRLVVATSLGVGTYLVPGPLSRLAAAHSGADVTVRTSQPEQAILAVENGEADFAVVTWYEQVLPTTLRAERLRSEPVSLCAGSGGAFDTERVSRTELATIPIVSPPAEVALSLALDSQLRSYGVESLNVVLRLGHAESIKAAVYNHGWAALLPRYSMTDEVRAGKMQLVDVEGVQLFEHLALITRRDVELSPFQSVALEAVKDALAAQAEPPSPSFESA